MNKPSTRILLILIVLALAAMACVGGGGDGGDSSSTTTNISTSQHAGIGAPEATATYGAQQFHIQLTEIANPDQP